MGRGLETAPGRAGEFAAKRLQLFLELLMHTGGKRTWARWEPQIRDALASAQHKCGQEDCCQDGSWPPVGAWGADGGTVYSTALGALTLLTPHRFPACKR